MLGLDTKSLVIGIALGAIVAPRVVALVASKTSK